MSTRAYICIEQQNNTYLGVYCHSAGYLTHTGSILFDYYQSEEKIKKLIELGNLLILKPNLEPDKNHPHCFNNPQIGVSLFYGRDGNYQNTSSKIINLNNLINHFWIEHCYLYKLDHNWYYIENKEKTKQILLKNALSKYYEELGFLRITGFYGKYTLEEIAYYRKQEELRKKLLKVLKKDQ